MSESAKHFFSLNYRFSIFTFLSSCNINHLRAVAFARTVFRMRIVQADLVCLDRGGNFRSDRGSSILARSTLFASIIRELITAIMLAWMPTTVSTWKELCLYLIIFQNNYRGKKPLNLLDTINQKLIVCFPRANWIDTPVPTRSATFPFTYLASNEGLVCADLQKRNILQ